MAEFDVRAVRTALTQMNESARECYEMGGELTYDNLASVVKVADMLLDVIAKEQAVSAELREQLRQADASFDRRIAANLAEVFGR